MENRIPNEWHKESAYNCLTPEQFAQFQNQYEIGDEMSAPCEECGKFIVGQYHRCLCGNIRCYITMGEDYESEYFYVEQW